VVVAVNSYWVAKMRTECTSSSSLEDIRRPLLLAQGVKTVPNEGNKSLDFWAIAFIMFVIVVDLEGCNSKEKEGECGANLEST